MKTTCVSSLMSVALLAIGCGHPAVGTSPYAVVTESRSLPPDPPVLVTAGPDTRIDFDRLFDAANREFIQRRIARIKGYIATTEESASGRLRQELDNWESRLSGLRAGSGPLRSLQYVTVFEGADHFVVAYFERGSPEHFACALAKSSYFPVSGYSWIARNLTQTSITLQ